jgi:protein involved in polysaccharide export with SLBB domain
MNSKQSLGGRLADSGYVLLILLVGSSILLAQDYSTRTRALDRADSRAEKQAEQMVSLPADRIIDLLRHEPGLFLEVKKLLVRKAFEQGRIVEREELTDEAVFRLIRDDDVTRALVTDEIQARNYVKAKPTQEELVRQYQRQGALANTNVPTAETSGLSQEDQFWTQQSRESRATSPNAVPPETLSPDNPLNTRPPGPQTSSPDGDIRRQLLQAQQSGNDGGMSVDPFAGITGGQQIGPGQQIAASQQISSQPIGSDQQIGSDQSAALMGLRGGDQASISPTSVAANQPYGVYGAGNTPGATGNGGVTPGGAPLSSMGNPLAQTRDLSGADEAPLSQQANLQTPSQQGWRPFRLPQSNGGQDQPALRHRPNPYADVPSLYDLYSQYQRRSPMLTRFGTEVFLNGTGNFERLPMDMPAGPDYVIGPGDGLNIDIWGSFSQRLRRVVDREGRVSLPEVGNLQVAGRSLGDVQRLVQTTLRGQFRSIQADVSLSRLHSVRVYVVGDVQRPGAYDVSSLSTPLNALYQAGGPTSVGSLRLMKHFRGKDLIETVDLYDLLLNGVHSGMQRIQSGDTILIPTVGPAIKIEGMVRRPAIYELNGEKSLAQVLQLAGGVLPSGTLRHIDVERVEAHESRSMLRLDVPENNNSASVTLALENFGIQDGDIVKISPILPYTDRTVYLEGHVFRPGKFAYQDGMKVTDLIKSYKDLLPEPYKNHAEIVRLQAPDNTPEVLAFNLEDALAGKDQDLLLKPFDTVRIFGRYDFEDTPVITVTGEVRDPGDHVTNGATYLRDAIYLAGNTNEDASLSDTQIFRKTDDGKLKVLSVNLQQALAGDPAANVLLQPKDRVFVHRDMTKTDPPKVSIGGEIARPGKYPLGTGMTAADLVRTAGGLKRSAYTEEADLTRFYIEHGSKVEGEHVSVPLAKALAGEPDADVRLHDGDVLTVRQLTGWNDMGATVDVKGEVIHPGPYGIQEGERLSSVIERAGGLRSDAYAYGTILERVEIRDVQEKHRVELIRTVQEEGANFKSPDDPATLQWKSTLDKLQNIPPIGRVVIHISNNTKRWANTPADIQLRAGDILFIPKRPNTVMVDGAVYNPTGIAFRPGKSAKWYLHQAGGPTVMAERKRTFVVRADGSVAGGPGNILSGGALDTVLLPGDMVVVPDKAFGGGLRWKETLQQLQVVSAIGVAIAVALAQ